MGENNALNTKCSTKKRQLMTPAKGRNNKWAGNRMEWIGTLQKEFSRYTSHAYHTDPRKVLFVTSARQGDCLIGDSMNC